MGFSPGCGESQGPPTCSVSTVIRAQPGRNRRASTPRRYHPVMVMDHLAEGPQLFPLGSSRVFKVPAATVTKHHRRGLKTTGTYPSQPWSQKSAIQVSTGRAPSGGSRAGSFLPSQPRGVRVFLGPRPCHPRLCSILPWPPPLPLPHSSKDVSACGQPLARDRSLNHVREDPFSRWDITPGPGTGPDVSLAAPSGR